MKKSLRQLFSLLLVLSLLVSLSISALAETVEDNPEGTTVAEVVKGNVMEENNGTVGTNNGTVVTNEKTGEIYNNAGTVGSYQEDGTTPDENTGNKGYIYGNTGDVINNDCVIHINGAKAQLNEDGSVKLDSDYYPTIEPNTKNPDATVVINDYTINNNYGKVTTNNNYIKENQEGGSVGTNNGDVIHNHGDVTTNGETGKIEDNGGTVSTNQGFVGTNNETITRNDGYVMQNYGTIGSNTSDDYEAMDKNCGVQSNYGTISSNSGTVYNNASNMKDAKYNEETDSWKYSNKMNEDGSAVPALIKNNTGTVVQNTGTVENAEGGTVESNFMTGTVENGNGGTVVENYWNGTVNNLNGGTVEYNYYGTVYNEAGGEVKINEGTVVNEAGGLLNDVLITSETSVDEDGNEYTEQSGKLVQFTGEAGTYSQYTIKIGMDDTTEDGADEKTYADIETDGVSEVWKQAAQNAAMDLKAVGKLFNREGYEVIGYVENNIAVPWTAPEEDPEEDTAPTVVYETSYTVTNYNSFLKLVWGKVKGVIVPPPVVEIVPETETEEYTIPNYMIAKYVREGTVIQRGTHLFKVIAVEDGTILVATMGRLNQADLDDMMGFLAKYFSEAQLERLIGEPELLSEELTEEHFGDELEHICFRATADLFEG